MEIQNTIKITNGVTRHPDYRMAHPVNLSFETSQHIAIVGANGAGKTRLVDQLTGRYPYLREEQLTYDFSPRVSKSAYDNIKSITFRDTYGAADGDYYYQQRWNTGGEDTSPCVRDVLEPESELSTSTQEYLTQEERVELYTQLGIERLLDKKLILLSSGELRRFQLVKALLSNPRILIMDNPYIGLDASTREILTRLLTRLTERNDLQIILVLSMLDDVPPFITHVLPVENLCIGEKQTRAAYLQNYRPLKDRQLSPELEQAIVDLPYAEGLFTENPIVGLHEVSIKYGTRTILKALDWQVLRGEKWALSGENGAGKSTLLSLVCADNPQSYACDITLFGRKRGSGESIWEIKRHIGYVSPEMHRAYQKDLPAIRIVASGLHDSIGLYVKPKPEQLGICEFWMNVFGVAHLKERTFLKLSSGEQRLVLLARAFVKDPELLILDEPLHGLDTLRRALVKEVISAFARRTEKTIIMVTHYAQELPDCIDKRIVLTRNI